MRNIARSWELNEIVWKLELNIAREYLQNSPTFHFINFRTRLIQNIIFVCYVSGGLAGAAELKEGDALK